MADACPAIAFPLRLAMPMVSPGTEEATRTCLAPRWHVVLLDDDDHTYEYVIEMLMRLFGKTAEEALQHAIEVDSTGRSIVDTTTRERAELKVEQIRSYGPDPRLARSRGSMAALIEPAE